MGPHLSPGSVGWAAPPLLNVPALQREVERNQELLTRIRQLQEREAEAEEKMKEQLERHRLCKQSLDAAGQKLREKEDGLAAAGEVRALLGLGSPQTLDGRACARLAPSESPSCAGADAFRIVVVI